MQVIMLKTGEVKQVAAGYARNYLFPNKLAAAATATAQAQAEQTRMQVVAEQKAQAEALAVLAKKLQGQMVMVGAKANNSGRLFAALHAEDIVSALAAQGLTVTAEQLKVSPIKQTGEHSVKVQLPGATPVVITINVTAA
jgi:large subunit ribosomal protein L9